MLSTIIVVSSSEGTAVRRPLAPVLRTLAALVPATVEGAVRDVTLLVTGRGDEVVAVADEAGCRLVQAETFADAFERSLAGAKGAWICVLQAGALPGRTFAEDVANALDMPGQPPQALLLRGEGGAFGRLFPQWAAVAGVIAPRERWQGRGCENFGDLLRRARPARTLMRRVALVA